MRKDLIALTCLLCLLLPACRRAPAALSDDAQRAEAARHAALARTRQAKLPELASEFQRIEQERGLPEHLTARRTSRGATSSGWVRPDGSVIADSENAAPVVAALFAADELTILETTLDHLYPAGAFEWDEKRLAAARELRRKFAEPLQRFEHAIERPHFELGVQYVQGYLADQHLLASAVAANRLLCITIAEHLADHDLAAALVAWPRLLAMPAALTRTGNLTALAAAARLRSEAFRVLQVLVRREDFDQATADYLCAALAEHLAEWPADSAVWVGERALALHAYEMIRAGELLSILDYRQMQRLRRAGALKGFGERVLANLDQDELFYLSAVRRIAAESDQPYRARRATLDELQQRLDELSGSPRYPAIAGDLLWPDLEWGVRLQACDRALCGGWLAALATAAGQPVEQAGMNPLTGEPFAVTRRGMLWEVRDIDLLGDQFQLGEEPLLVRVIPESRGTP